MKRTVFVIVTLLLFNCNSFGQADTILNRYKQYLFATLTIQKDADKLAASLNKNGQWSDINYQDNEKAGWKPLIHLNRLRDLAFAYAKPQSKFYHQLKILQAAK